MGERWKREEEKRRWLELGSEVLGFGGFGVCGQMWGYWQQTVKCYG